MQDILDLIRQRRSTKKYLSDPVPKEIIDKVIEAGLYAASGKGMQAPVIVAVTDKETRDRMSSLNAKVLGADIDPFYNAPVVLAVLADTSVPTYLYDGSITIGNMMLEAESLGIGSCWIHRAKEVFASDEGKEILKSAGLSGDYEGIGHCVLGYPANEKQPPLPRKENRVFYIG